MDKASPYFGGVRVMPFESAVLAWKSVHPRSGELTASEAAAIEEVRDFLTASLEGVSQVGGRFAEVTIELLGSTSTSNWRAATVTIAVNRRHSPFGAIRAIGSKLVIEKGLFHLSLDPTDEHPNHWELRIEVV